MSAHNGNMMIGALQKPKRNRYFYGKQLDVRHFELEQDYFNAKRWLLNRLISGFGVVCGLNVMGCEDDNHEAIIVTPGLAIDKWGREIIVVKDALPFRIAPPAEGATPHGEENFIHICLAYHECEADPAPMLESECNGGQRCMPDTIHERYKITSRTGKAPEILHRCQIPDLTNDDTREIDYSVMVKWVSEQCPARSNDPCIPLAEIEFHDGACESINIEVRPIVYTNDLLFEMILAMTEPDKSTPRGGKY